MLEKPILSEKILVLGFDGLDPRLLHKYVSEGKMPNFKKFIEVGAQREDLVMLGAQPTVTPAQWTTLGTGAYPVTHGVTDFFAPADDLDGLAYNFDSRNCTAEPIWDCFAEAGKQTLVFHWPGSAWPPTSDSPYLHVVDGTTPGGVGYGSATVEGEVLVAANEKVKEATYLKKAASNTAAPCVVEGLEIENVSSDSADKVGGADFYMTPVLYSYILNDDEGMRGFPNAPIDVAQSPIKPAQGWVNAPEGAKEFTVLLAGGKIRRPGLILKNNEGIYDRIAVFKNKKEESPIFTAHVGKLVRNVIDQGLKKEEHVECIRNFNLLYLAEDGSSFRMHVSGAMDIHNDSVWYPKRLYNSVIEKVGYPPPTSNVGGQDEDLLNSMRENWYVNTDWQADALNYLMDNEKYNLVLSHFHALDLQAHQFIRFMSESSNDGKNWENKLPVETYLKLMEDLYTQQDYYASKFLHYLDEGWTIFIVSDHALVCPAHVPPMLGDIVGLNVVGMEELGYTVLKLDENGSKLRECDWSKTKAVANRANHITINLKGRDKYGIVDPEDKYELEEQIMTDLYGLKDPKTGKRVIALALRNRDAYVLGMGGPKCGDIVYFTAEGYNYDHADALSTAWGEADTSVSPTLIAAGRGLKKRYNTNRIIRQVDLVPTIAILGGVRMPETCEGAPVYQIMETY